MRTLDPFIVSADWVFEQVLYREIQRVAERTLTEAERKALWQYAEKPRKRVSRRAERAIQKLRLALGIGEDAQAEMHEVNASCAKCASWRTT